MAVNCLAPGYCRVSYSSNAHSHTMTIPVWPGAGADLGKVKLKDGSLAVWDVALFSLLSVVKAQYPSASVFSGAELYTQADCDSAPVFVASTDFGGGISGTSALAPVPWAQEMFTFRSTGGGQAKLLLMETVSAVNQRTALSAATGSKAAIRDYLVGSSSLMVARDSTPLSIPLNWTTKTNDMLRKRYGGL